MLKEIKGVTFLKRAGRIRWQRSRWHENADGILGITVPSTLAILRRAVAAERFRLVASDLTRFDVRLAYDALPDHEWRCPTFARQAAVASLYMSGTKPVLVSDSWHTATCYGRVQNEPWYSSG